MENNDRYGHENKEGGISLHRKNLKSSYKCINCDYETVIAFHLRRHMIVSHKITEKNIYKCNFCSKVYNALKSLDSHQEVCYENSKTKAIKKFKHEQCFGITKGLDVLKSDLEIVEINTINEDLEESQVLNEALPIVQPAQVNTEFEKDKIEQMECFNDRILVCSKCNDFFVDHIEYKGHVEENNCFSVDSLNIKTGKQIFGLPISLPVVFVRRLSVANFPKLARQQSVSSSDEEIQIKKPPPSPWNTKNPVQCNICWKEFSYRENLYRHINSLHKNPFSFPCNLCKKAFSQKSVLDDHILQVHTTCRRFHCSKCNYGANRRVYFLAHKKNCIGSIVKSESGPSHSKDPNKNHKRMNKEERKRNCPCSICKTAFFDISTLIEHMKTHCEADLHGGKLEDKQNLISVDNSDNENIKRDFNEIRRRNLSRSKRFGTRTFSTGFYEDSENESMQLSQSNEKVTESKNNFEENAERQSCVKNEVATIFHECIHCDRKFEKKSLLDDHVKEIHTVSNNSTLSWSSKENSNEMRAALAKALAIIYPEKASEDLKHYRCKLCSIICLNATALESHLKRHL